VLVTTHGIPKILDFGVARLIDGTSRPATIHTQAGQIVGTLAYMSPEQFSSDSAAVDTRCDIYAMGVILFELLAGRPPLELSGKSIVEAARIAASAALPRLGA